MLRTLRRLRHGERGHAVVGGGESGVHRARVQHHVSGVLAVIDPRQHEIRAVADKKGVKPSQLALAWAMRDGMVPIPGTRRIKYLEENVGAAAITLTPADLAALDEVAPVGAAAGDRYTPQGMAALNH